MINNNLFSLEKKTSLNKKETMNENFKNKKINLEALKKIEVSQKIAASLVCLRDIIKSG